MRASQPEPMIGLPEVVEEVEPSPFPRLASQLAAILFVIALPLLVVSSAVRVLLSDVGYYRQGLRDHGAQTRTGIPLSELDRAVAEIVAYFENDADALRIVVEVGGEEQALFNAREVEHMRDVKVLVRALFTLNEVALVFVLAFSVGSVLWARERGIAALARLSLAGLGVGAVVLLALGSLVILGFDAAWSRFHEIAFRNDLWRLNPGQDRLIQMFPESFWEEATLLVALLSSAGGAALAALAGGYLLWQQRRGRRTGG